MASIVVGGHSSNIGKTTVVAGLIAALRGLGWTAVKISLASHSKRNVRLAANDRPFEIIQEQDPSGNSDTQRFLAAGAERALLIRTQVNRVAELMPELRAIMSKGPHTIIESNSILRHLHPDLYFAVLNFDIEDFKESAREFFPRADAAIIAPSGKSAPTWPGLPPDLLAKIPQFHMSPNGIPDDLIDYVRERISPFSHWLTH